MDEKEIMDPEVIQGLFDNGVSTASVVQRIGVRELADEDRFFV